MSTTNLIITPGDDDIDLKNLQSFALTVSWCSKAILEVFYDNHLTGVSGIDYTSLAGDEEEAVIYAGQLTVPKDEIGNYVGDSKPNQKYVWYSKQFPLVSGTEMLTKATFQAEATLYGGGTSEIKIETTFNSGLSWYTWYDTSYAGTGYGFPGGFLDRSMLEHTDPDTIASGQNCQIKATIKTDTFGWGGQIDYIAVLTDPDLYAE